MAFEEEGFCVVRGPDLLWGGDIHRFHPPAGKFDGVIGGPPCQAFSRLRHMVEANGYTVAANLIPEFERCVREAQPAWFLMENVPDAPFPKVPRYQVYCELVRDVWVGGATSRLRRFSFGSPIGTRLQVEQLALHSTQPEPAILAGGGYRPVPIKLRGGEGYTGIPKKSTAARNMGWKTKSAAAAAAAAQGLPADFDLPAFTAAAKCKAIGNGVPLPMGRAIAKAVKAALARFGTEEGRHDRR
jgi:DNA (cytosine-5)-methyltransferase 1